MADLRQLQPDPPFGPDINAVLKEEHSRIASLLDRLNGASTPQERRQVFGEVSRALARHEVGEEEVVYPHLSRLGDEGARVRSARLAEEQQGKALVARMSRRALLSPGGRRFIGDCSLLRYMVRGHAAAEEAEVLPLLEGEDPTKLRVMATLSDAACASAPTRAHPHVPANLPSLLGAGPMVGLVDRLRDRARSAVVRVLDSRVPSRT